MSAQKIARLIASVGAVYCCRAADGTAKIGWAFDVESRIRRLQIGNPRRLSLVAFLPGTRTLESDLHKLFSDRRLHGEWFDDRDGEITDCLAELQHRSMAGEFYR